MNCERVTAQLADLLDGLLDAAVAGEVRQHLEACGPCAARLDELSRLRTRIYTPELAPAPPADLADRIRRAAAPRRSTWPALLRYAAVFLAGVGVALAFRAEPTVVEVPVETVVRVAPSPEAAPVVQITEPRVPRRIR